MCSAGMTGQRRVERAIEDGERDCEGIHHWR